MALFGRQFVKWFVLCYRTVVLSCLWRSCTLAIRLQWTDQDETWQADMPRPWPHCVRWGPSSPSPKGAYPQFSAHICCGQMAAWIKMPLGMELGLGPGDFLLDGDPAPPAQKGAEPPPQIFGPCLLWPNVWMDQGGTWHGGRPQSRRLCVTWGPRPPPLKGVPFLGAGPSAGSGAVSK